jgi:hypothetical protein
MTLSEDVNLEEFVMSKDELSGGRPAFGLAGRVSWLLPCRPG